MDSSPARYDIVMLGTFAAWRLGTLQARALPLAVALGRHGIRCAIVTTPWDLPNERGVTDVYDGVPIINTPSASASTAPLAVQEQLALVRSLQPRAVHVFKPKGFGGLTGLALRTRIPVFVDSDDWEGDGGWNQAGSYGPAQRRVFDWQERTLLRTAYGVTAASTVLYQRARLARAADRPDSVWMIPNGLNRAWFARLVAARCAARPALDQPRTVLLYSRFAEFGVDWLPRFARALDRVADCPVRIVVVGADGKSWASGERVFIEMHGYVERQSIPAILGNADIAVFPYESSLLTMAKQSVKLLELMASGCAVIGSDVGDIASVLGGAGLTLSDGDPDAFARATARLLSHGGRMAALGVAAQRRVEDHFLVESTIVTRLVSAYRASGVLA